MSRQQIYLSVSKLNWSNYETRVGLAPVDDVYVSTQRDNSIYIHILDVKEFEKITIPAINKKILSAEILKGEKLDFVQNDNGIKITLSEFALRNNAVDTIVTLYITYWVAEELYHRKMRKQKSPENAVFTGLLARCGGDSNPRPTGS